MSRGGTAKRIAKNSIFLLIGDLVSKILTLALAVFIARYLGDIGYGKYAFAFAFTSLFVIVSDLGLSVLSIREIARDKSKVNLYLINVSTIKVILSIIMISLITFSINLANYPSETKLIVYIAGLVMIFRSFTQFFRNLSRAFERMEYDAATRIAENVLIVSFVVLLVILFRLNVIEIVLTILIIQILTFILTLMIFIKKFTKPKFTLDVHFSIGLIKSALPFGLQIIFTTIYFQIDTVMLSMMKGDAVVGWYNAAYQLVLGLMFIPNAFVSSVYPVMSRYFCSFKDYFKIVYEKSLKFLLILAILLGISVTLLADKIILLLYGGQFVNSIIALKILIWAGSLIFLTLFIGHVLASIDKQEISTINTGICAVINITLNYLLIPSYSYIGASISTVVTELLVFVLGVTYLQRHIPIRFEKIFLKPIIAGLAMAMFIHVFYPILNVYINLFCATFIYFAMLYLLKAFDREELNLVKGIIKVVRNV